MNVVVNLVNNDKVVKKILLFVIYVILKTNIDIGIKKVRTTIQVVLGERPRNIVQMNKRSTDPTIPPTVTAASV